VLNEAAGMGDAVRWACSTGVEDIEAMTYLGFLYSGQSDAAAVVLGQAQELLFEKDVNPVAAAAGAFGLLSMTEESNSRERPQWRNWIKNLYSRFPRLPDAAIAMAKLYVRYGEDAGTQSQDIDVEKLRRYVLDAVRRGLPYLTFGIRILSDGLLLLVRDDEAAGRKGPMVDDTKRAHELVRQLGRLVVSDRFFTVVRLPPPS
jgi:hypothetical protein